MEIRIGTLNIGPAFSYAARVKAQLLEIGMSVQFQEYSSKEKKPAVPSEEYYFEAPDNFSSLTLALAQKEIDLAMVDADDFHFLPSLGIKIAAVLKRNDPRDVVAAMSEDVDLDNFSGGFSIGVNSESRETFLNFYSPQIKTVRVHDDEEVGLRGVSSGKYDGFILGYEQFRCFSNKEKVIRKLNPNVFIPSPCQGLILLLSLDSFNEKALINSLNHKPSSNSFLAENSFRIEMEKESRSGIFALATQVGESISMIGGLALLGGKTIISKSIDGACFAPEPLGKKLAHTVLKCRSKEYQNYHAQKN